MHMSVREFRANLATVIEAAEKGERVTITRNGKPVAEIGPSRQAPEEGFLARLERVRKEMGFDNGEPGQMSADEWLEWFNDPAWTREIWGKYLDDDFDDSEDYEP
jgi:antitoxin (DNA-binding transcriptional repressor) of toxin-antitoxin stability system